MEAQTNILSIPNALGGALRPLTLVCGHYGVGKTNFVLNLALTLSKRENTSVCTVDLDIVNPYFRTSEYSAVLNDAGVRVVSPVMANSSLDSPSLSAEVDGVIDWAMSGSTAKNSIDKVSAVTDSKEIPTRIALFDIGGDDAGATALGRYSQHVKDLDIALKAKNSNNSPNTCNQNNPDSEHPTYSLIYVVNAYRNLTQTPAEALEIMREIERASGLRVTGIVNNSHLRDETTANTILQAEQFGIDCAKAAGVPLLTQTAPANICSNISDIANTADAPEKCHRDPQKYFTVKKIVKTPWE